MEASVDAGFGNARPSERGLTPFGGSPGSRRFGTLPTRPRRTIKLWFHLRSARKTASKVDREVDVAAPPGNLRLVTPATRILGWAWRSERGGSLRA